MAKLHGKFGQVQFVEPAGGTPALVLGLNAWTVTFEGDAEEATDFNSGGVKEYLAGCVGHSATAEGYYNTSEPQHQGGLTLATYPDLIPKGSTATAVFFADTVSATTAQWGGTYIVTSAEYNCSVSGNVGFKLGLQGTGLLTANP